MNFIIRFQLKVLILIIWFLIGCLLILLAQYVLKPLVQHESSNKICKPSTKGTLTNVVIMWACRLHGCNWPTVRLEFCSPSRKLSEWNWISRCLYLLTDIFELAKFTRWWTAIPACIIVLWIWNAKLHLSFSLFFFC